MVTFSFWFEILSSSHFLTWPRPPKKGLVMCIRLRHVQRKKWPLKPRVVELWARRQISQSVIQSTNFNFHPPYIIIIIGCWQCFVPALSLPTYLPSSPSIEGLQKFFTTWMDGLIFLHHRPQDSLMIKMFPTMQLTFNFTSLIPNLDQQKLKIKKLAIES